MGDSAELERDRLLFFAPRNSILLAMDFKNSYKAGFSWYFIKNINFAAKRQRRGTLF
jgi:hypothetical protein